MDKMYFHIRIYINGHSKTVSSLKEGNSNRLSQIGVYLIITDLLIMATIALPNSYFIVYS